MHIGLPPGLRLGPYEILSAIGAGGMGEVYRARDPRLDREVAIKVLPEAWAQDPMRLARFEHEARAVAALSHPNIVATFDFGVHEATPFLVMELLDGETLRERLHRGALPARKGADYGTQIARGLAAAHDKGLVHRDLKPENIFLLRDGQVKILDFGLARQCAPPPAASSEGGDQTVVLTDPGTVVGTVGYMAPEQVRGHLVDGRSDLFALGAVLYEMLSGARAFHRGTVAATMNAILTDDPPPLVAAGPAVPPALDQIVRHCLEKNPAERFQTARDVVFALTTLAGWAAPAGSIPTVAARPGWQKALAAAAVIAVALAAGMFVEQRRTPPAETVSFEKKTWHRMWLTNARFGPDGQSIVFSAAPTGNLPELFVIRPDSVLPQPVGQKATHLLSVSSKGELAVLTGVRHLHHRRFDGTLARMTLDGEPRPWLENVREADWSPDGTALAVIRHVGARDHLEYPAGKLRHQFDGYLSDLRVSPDGTQVAFFEHQLLGDNRGWVKVLTATGEVRTLAGEYLEVEGLAWTPDGRQVLFSAADRDMIQPFIVNVAGTPVARPRAPGAAATMILDVAADGRLLLAKRDEFRYSIRALLPGETAEREMPWLDYATSATLSRDAKTLMFADMSQSAGANYAVTLRDVASGRVIRLGEGDSWGLSPDGRWAGGWIPATGDIRLYPTGAGSHLPISRGAIVRYTSEPQWFPDGRRILVCGNEAGAPPRCYHQAINGGAPIAITPGGIMEGMLAPDGVTLLTLSTAGEFGVRAVGEHTQGLPARGVNAADVLIGWSDDSRAVFVNAGHAIPARVERVDVATGMRLFLREVAPLDRTGVVDLLVHQWIDGGRGHVYSYQRMLDSIFVMTAR